MAIVELTGLSYPAVRLAIERYDAGGAAAPMPAPPGRAPGDGTRLKAGQEKAILRASRQAPLNAWLAKRQADIEVFYPPGHGPELDPDERLNADPKHASGGRVPLRTKARQPAAASERMPFIETHPERAKSAFRIPASNTRHEVFLCHNNKP